MLPENCNVNGPAPSSSASDMGCAGGMESCIPLPVSAPCAVVVGPVVGNTARPNVASGAALHGKEELKQQIHHEQHGNSKVLQNEGVNVAANATAKLGFGEWLPVHRGIQVLMQTIAWSNPPLGSWAEGCGRGCKARKRK